MPIATSVDQGVISQYGAYTYADVQFTKNVVITDLVAEQLKPTTENNGFLLGLMTDITYRTQNYYSSDFSDATKRPKLTVKFTLPDAKPLISLKKTLDGGFVTLDKDRKLRFNYTEEYNDIDNLLTYNIYDDKHEIVMTQNNESIPVKTGRNQVVLNIDCCLSCSNYFILEVINEKNEKWYLRFKTDSNDGSEGGEVIVYPQGHPCSLIGM